MWGVSYSHYCSSLFSSPAQSPPIYIPSAPGHGSQQNPTLQPPPCPPRSRRKSTCAGDKLACKESTCEEGTPTPAGPLVPTSCPGAINPLWGGQKGATSIMGSTNSLGPSSNRALCDSRSGTLNPRPSANDATLMVQKVIAELKQQDGPLGHLEIGPKIGQGGYGVVHKGEGGGGGKMGTWWCIRVVRVMGAVLCRCCCFIFYVLNYWFCKYGRHIIVQTCTLSGMNE